MTKLLMYLLESSAVLAFFYLLYVLVLRRETFFSLNRFFLIGILVFSLLFPLMSFDFNLTKSIAVEQPIEEISKLRMSYYEALALWEFENFSAATSAHTTGTEVMPVFSNVDWSRLLFSALIFLYAIGVVVCLSKLGWVLRGIRKMIVIYPQEEIEGIKVVKIPYPIAPFSFLNYVFLHDAMAANTPEFEQVLAHERIHIRQKHSIDLIFVQLLASFLWFNPVIWQLIKSLKTTHEYIADKNIINSGYSLVEYQALLLRQLISNNSYGLVHNFNLSFIKKRITMMKNKKSGWAGKVKVAIAIACSAVFSALIVQCNSKLEEQDLIPTEIGTLSDFSDGINLPVLPNRRDPNTIDLTDALHFNIVGNKLTIDGEPYEVSEISGMLEKGGYPPSLVVVMSVDKGQKMDFIRDVQTELRKANRRRINYMGQTSTGEKVETPLLLPPTPDNAAKFNIPSQPNIDDVMAAGKMDILKIEMGDNAGPASQQKVYDFVKSHIQKQSADYIVSARFSDNDTYNDYLLSLVSLKDGFNQIYQERAQELFGKSLFDIDKEEFQTVREGVPMAISIAED